MDCHILVFSICAAKLRKTFETGLVQIGSFSNTDEENEKSMVESGEKYVSLLPKKKGIENGR